MKIIIIFLFTAFIIGPASYGFKSIMTDKQGKQLLDAAESTFQIQSHAELYNYVTLDSEGAITQGRMFIIYEYKANQVNGVFRLLTEKNYPGATLLCNQITGELPKLYLSDSFNSMEGFVPLEKRNTPFGNTNWFLENIYDDDKNPWKHRPIGSAQVRQEACTILESRYESKALAQNSFCSYRRLYLSNINKRMLRYDAFDSQDQLIFQLEVPYYETVRIGNREHLRAQRIQLTDHRNQSTTILHRIQSAWEIPLDASWFEPQNLAAWNKERDALIINKLKQNKNP